MADGRKNNGGPRPGAGRPRKADEENIKKIMDSIASQEEGFQLLWEKAQDDQAALNLWMGYRNGKPTNRVDVTTDGEKLPPPITISAEDLKSILDSDEDDLDEYE